MALWRMQVRSWAAFDIRADDEAEALKEGRRLAQGMVDGIGTIQSWDGVEGEIHVNAAWPVEVFVADEIDADDVELEDLEAQEQEEETV